MNEPRWTTLPVTADGASADVQVACERLPHLLGRAWRALGGRVVHVPEGDEFDAALLLDEARVDPATNPPPAFVPWPQLRGRAHVMVDSLPRAGTQFVLSHWPSVRNPVALRSDTSTGIVLDYLADCGGWPQVPWVSAGHLDVDGLLALHVATCPAQRPLAPFWRELARAGDFRVATRPAVHRALVVLEAEMARAGAAAPPGAEQAFRHLLDWLQAHGPALAADAAPGLQAPAVVQVLAHADHSARVLRAHGDPTLWPEADFASLELPPDLGPPFADPDRPGLGLDEVALHAHCSALQRLVSQGGAHRLDQRYETWVQAPDTAWACRRDLQPLRDELAAIDPDAHWRYDGVHHPFASLRTERGCRSRLTHGWLARRCAAYLRAHPPGWDPHCLGLKRQRPEPGPQARPALFPLETEG